MCQVNGPSISVQCPRCRAGYYEQDPHTCKVFVPFAAWDAELQAQAARYASFPVSSNWIERSGRRATIHVAKWPKWKREYAWAEEFEHSVKSADQEGQ